MNPIPSSADSSQSTPERSPLVSFSFAEVEQNEEAQGISQIQESAAACIPCLPLSSSSTTMRSPLSFISRFKQALQRKIAPPPAWASIAKVRSDETILACTKSFQRHAKHFKWQLHDKLGLPTQTIGEISKAAFGSSAFLQNPFTPSQDVQRKIASVQVTQEPTLDSICELQQEDQQAAVKQQKLGDIPHALNSTLEQLPELGHFYRNTTLLLKNYLQMSYQIAQGEVPDKRLERYSKASECRDEIIEETLSTHAKLKHSLEQALDHLSLNPDDAKLAGLSIAIGEPDLEISTSTRGLGELKGERQLASLKDVLAELFIQSEQLHDRLEHKNPIAKGIHLSKSAPTMPQSVTRKSNEPSQNSVLDSAAHDRATSPPASPLL